MWDWIAGNGWLHMRWVFGWNPGTFQGYTHEGLWYVFSLKSLCVSECYQIYIWSKYSAWHLCKRQQLFECQAIDISIGSWEKEMRNEQPILALETTNCTDILKVVKLTNKRVSHWETYDSVTMTSSTAFGKLRFS